MNTNRQWARPLLLATTLLTTACAYQPYDADNPQPYVDYWCQPDNLRDSLLYNLSKDHDERHPSTQPQTPPESDADRHQRCIEQHQAPLPNLLPQHGKA